MACALTPLSFPKDSQRGCIQTLGLLPMTGLTPAPYSLEMERSTAVNTSQYLWPHSPLTKE